jgi:hypothetical protein
MTDSPLPFAVFERHAAGQTVIPVGYVDGHKRPLVRWKQLQTTRPDLDTVEEWACGFPDCMWAIVTGPPAGCLVLDFDGPVGEATRKAMGLQAHRVTPSGGSHVDVVLPDWAVRTICNSADPVLAESFPGLDIRGTGGLAVVHGSTPKGVYQQVRATDPDPFEVIPDSLLPLLRRPRTTRSSTPGGRSPEETPMSTTHVTPAIQRRTVDRLHDMAIERLASGAARNDTGFWLATQCRDHDLTEDEAREVMLTYQAGAPQEDAHGEIRPYTANEAMGSLASAYSREPREPFLTGAGDGVIVNADILVGAPCRP